MEGDETFTLSATFPGYTITPLTLTITDNEMAAITFGDDVSVAENGNSVTVTATLDVAVEGSGFTVNASTGGGTATADSDYTAVTAQTLSFAGMAGDTAEITVAITDDGDGEGNETFTVSLDSGSLSRSLPITITDTVTVTITDDDTATVTLGDAMVGEAGGTVMVTATLDVEVPGGFTVEVSTGDDTATAGSDYTAVSGETLNFTGTVDETQEFMVTVAQDTVVEGAETFTVSLSGLAGTAATVVITDTATVTITDDDTPSVTLGDVTVAENVSSGSVTVTATLNNVVVTGGFTVNVSTGDDTATAGSDYTAVSGETLNFTGTVDETQEFMVAITDDSVVETDETFTLALSGLGGTTVTPFDISDTATVTIEDNDSAALTLGDGTVGEGAGTATVTVTLDVMVPGGFTVEASTADGTATAGTDYTAVSGEALSFTGTAGETQTFTVAITDNDTIGTDKTFTVSLGNLAGTTAMVTTSDTATITIADDDTPTVTLGDETVGEGDGMVTVTATLSRAVSGGFTVDASTADGTGPGAATAGSDYTAVTPTMLSFTGTEGETQEFTVAITDDSDVEEDETFTLSLGNLAGTSDTVIITDTATVTITDDDATVPLTLSLNPTSVSERSGTATVSVTASVPADSAPATAVEVAVTVAGGTAVAGEDFTAVPAFTITLEANAASGTGAFVLTVAGDDGQEDAETLIVSGTARRFVVAPATLTLVDGTASAVELVGIELVRETIAEVSSAVASRVSRQVSRRVVAPVVVGNLDLQTSLARGLSANRQALNEGGGSWRELLGGSSFEFRVGEDPDGLPLSDSGSSRSSGVGVWAAVAGRRLSHSGGGFGDYDGRLFFVHAGADLRIGQGLLAGLAVSSSRGEFDFDDSTLDADTELLNYTLYLGGPLGDVADLWATLGSGTGEIVSGPDGARDTRDLRMTAASFGGRANVASGGGLELDFEGEVSSGNLKLDDSGGDAGPASDVHSLRLALDLGKDTEEDSGILLARSVKFGVRLEGGDGETGTGAGIGARLSRADPDTGLTLELTGDVLFSREEDGKTWEGGLGGSVRYQQQEHGRGLSLHTRSSYSTASEDPVRLWLENGTTGSDASAEAVFDVEAGYGLPMLRGDILLTPYYGFEFTRENARQHLLGSRVRIHPMLELELESAWRDTVPGRDSEGRLDLRLRMRW